MSFTPIRKRDANGALVEAGYEWSELRPGTFIPIMFCMILSGLVAIFAFIALLASPRNMGDALPVFLISGGIAWYCWRVRGRHGARKRSLLFRSTGETIAPQGVARGDDIADGQIPHARIASIEARPHGQTHNLVVLIDKGGHEGRLSEMLSAEDSRLVAVQLNLALSEIRAVISGAQKSAASQIVID